MALGRGGGGREVLTLKGSTPERLGEKGPPAVPGRGWLAVCLGREASLLSRQPPGENSTKEARPPLCVLSLVGWAQRVGSGVSPAAAFSNSQHRWFATRNEKPGEAGLS